MPQSRPEQEVSDALIDTVACELTVDIFMPHVTILTQLDAGLELYFIASGAVEMVLLAEGEGADDPLSATTLSNALADALLNARSRIPEESGADGAGRALISELDRRALDVLGGRKFSVLNAFPSVPERKPLAGAGLGNGGAGAGAGKWPSSLSGPISASRLQGGGGGGGGGGGPAVGSAPGSTWRVAGGGNGAAAAAGTQAPKPPPFRASASSILPPMPPTPPGAAAAAVAGGSSPPVVANGGVGSGGATLGGALGAGGRPSAGATDALSAVQGGAAGRARASANSRRSLASLFPATAALAASVSSTDLPRVSADCPAPGPAPSAGAPQGHHQPGLPPSAAASGRSSALAAALVTGSGGYDVQGTLRMSDTAGPSWHPQAQAAAKYGLPPPPPLLPAGQQRADGLPSPRADTRTDPGVESAYKSRHHSRRSEFGGKRTTDGGEAGADGADWGYNPADIEREIHVVRDCPI